MNKKLRSYLESIGLAPGASEQEAWAYFNEKLNSVQRAQAEKLKGGSDPTGNAPAASGATHDAPAAPPEMPGGRGTAPDHRLQTGATPDRTPEQIATAAVRAERERVAALTELAGDDVPEEVLDAALRDGLTVEQAGPRFLAAIRERRPAPITIGRESIEKLGDVLVDAAFLGEAERFGLTPERQTAAREFGGLRLQGLARAVLGRSGQRAPDNPDRLFATAVTTNTFGYVLSTIMGRSLARGYQEFTSTLRLWAGEREAPDFRTRTDVRMGEFAAPEKINDGGELPHDTIGDSAETYNAETYGKTFTLTRKTWINDDLGALRDWPRKLGRAMARNIDQIGYDLLVSASGVGPTMGEDSLALFDTTRATPNYQTGAGTVLGDTGLATGKKLMRKLKHGDVFINVIPRILLVPPELEHTAMKLVQSQELMIGSDSSATVFPTKNVHQGTLAPIVEPRLSAATNGTTAWYLIADPLQAESLVVVYLSGNRNPVIEQVNPVGILGLGWRAYHDVGVAFVDWRGIVRSKGA